MTTTIPTPSIPSFRTHSRMLAGVRALAIVVLCAALTAAFLAQVWNAPRAQQLEVSVASAADLPSR
jgi:hypothetical protein